MLRGCAEERPGTVDLVDPEGGVEFDDVVFRYPTAAESAIASMQTNAGLGGDTDPDIDALEGLSLTVAPGGHDARDLTLDSLRRSIGVVWQDPHLLHESIGDNLRYANPDATDDELVAAAKAARLHDTIAVGCLGVELPEREERPGLDSTTRTDPRSRQLSCGFSPAPARS